MTKPLIKVFIIVFPIIMILIVSCGNVTTLAGSSQKTTIPTLTPPSVEWLVEHRFSHPEIPRILSEQLKQMMDNREPVVVIDTREEHAFLHGHIPQSINLPEAIEIEQIARFHTLPKDVPIVFY
jgi:hypothetical protein